MQHDILERAHDCSYKAQVLLFGSCGTTAKSLISFNLFPQLQNRNTTTNIRSMYSTRLIVKAILRQLYANTLYTL